MGQKDITLFACSDAKPVARINSWSPEDDLIRVASYSVCVTSWFLRFVWGRNQTTRKVTEITQSRSQLIVTLQRFVTPRLDSNRLRASAASGLRG